MDFETQLNEKRNSVNQKIAQLLDSRNWPDSCLKKAINYTLQAPGKRIRAAIVLWSYEIIAPDINNSALTAAAAIEMVHTYSLIHDDLPAMDNDDLRRGIPTCHKEFDEATAILTGDALLTFAFEILAKEITPHQLAVKLIDHLAQAAGPDGMIAGQIADLQAEKTTPTKDTLEYIHINKTAKMFQCAAALGALCANANEKQLNNLREFGLNLGLSFQIADDILDISSSNRQLGKTPGKDQKAGKITYPALVGIEKSKQLQKQYSDQAISALEPFGQNADTLKQLAGKLLQRKS